MPGIRLGTLNLRDGRGGKMHHVARCLNNHNVDIAILTETKLERPSTQLIGNYQFAHAPPPKTCTGGVSLAYRTDDSRFSVEGVECLENIVVFSLLTAQNLRVLVIGVYIPPGNPAVCEETGDKVNTILKKYPRNSPRIILGDLNSNPHRQPLRPQDVVMASNWAEWGIEDLGSHFRTKRGTRFTTWHQVAQGQLRSSLCDFILTDRRRQFTKLKAVEPRYYDSDHRLLYADMQVEPAANFRRALRGRRDPPRLNLPQPDPHLDPRLDVCYANKQECQINHQFVDKSTWVSEELLRLYDLKTQVRKLRHTETRRQRLNQLTNQIRRRKRADRLAHANQACNGILASLGAKDVDSAWGWCKRWYREASFRALRPSPQDLDEIFTSFDERYRADGVVREPFPTHVQPFDIDDSIPSEAEISQALGRVRTRKAGGHLGMKAEHIKAWNRDIDRLRRENQVIPPNHPWLEFVSFVQSVFETGRTPARLGIAELVILPKPGGGVRGIGLLEPIWKVISAIIDHRIKVKVKWDRRLHGFLPKRSTGTAITDTRLRSDLATAKLLPYHRVYIDLTKAYDCVDRNVLLQLLEAYGVGPKMRGILESQWAAQQFITKQSGFYGRVIRPTRGVTQGGIESPTLFNIAIDAVAREWEAKMEIDPVTPDPLEVEAGFYADDSIIGGTDADRVQEGLDTLSDLMGRVGLELNVDKTESQAHVPGGIHHSWNSPAYEHRMTGFGESPETRRRMEIECPHCQVKMLASSLRRHMEAQHERYVAPPPTARRTLFNPGVYTVDMPTRGAFRACPVLNCPGTAATRAGLRKHFKHRHPQSVLEFAGEQERGICPDCGLSIATAQMNRHRDSASCKNHQKRTRRLEGIRQTLEATERRFTVGGTTLKVAEVFKYLGKPTPPYCTDITAVQYNIKRARSKWAMLRSILVSQNMPPTIASIFYKAVVQAVLLYGSETWVLTKRTLGMLQTFHNRIARQLTGRHIYQAPNGDWIYPNPEATLRQAGLFTIQEYLRRRREYITPYLEGHPVTSLGQQQQRDANNFNQKFLWDNLDEPLLREENPEA